MLGVVVLVLISWPTAARADDWYTLAVNDQALIVANRTAIAASSRSAQVQEIQIFAGLHAVAGTAMPVRRLDIGLKVDCGRHLFRPEHFTALDDAGNTLLSWDADLQQGKWQSPATGSANAFLVAAVCTRKFDPARLRKGADIAQLQRLFVAATTGQ